MYTDVMDPFSHEKIGERSSMAFAPWRRRDPSVASALGRGWYVGSTRLVPLQTSCKAPFPNYDSCWWKWRALGHKTKLYSCTVLQTSSQRLSEIWRRWKFQRCCSFYTIPYMHCIRALAETSHVNGLSLPAEHIWSSKKIINAHLKDTNPHHPLTVAGTLVKLADRRVKSISGDFPASSAAARMVKDISWSCRTMISRKLHCTAWLEFFIAENRAPVTSDRGLCSGVHLVAKGRAFAGAPPCHRCINSNIYQPSFRCTSYLWAILHPHFL